MAVARAPSCQSVNCPSSMLRCVLRLLRYVFTLKRIFLSYVILAAIYISSRSSMESVPTGLRVEESSRPGNLFDITNVRVRHPVVMIPGMFCSALELWKAEPCAKYNATASFRLRMFGGMLYTLLSDPECYLRHVSIHRDDPAKDPDGIRMRVAKGFDGSDFLIPGFWVWAKLLVNLADIGYDPNLLLMATYDWRLGPHSLEARDFFMTRLKVEIESLHRHTGEKIVAIGHSYGCTVFTAFLNWADDASPGWTEEHVHAYVMIGGALLGAPKAVATLLSGEMKDTAMLPATTKLLVDARVPRIARRDAIRTWESMYLLSPTGDETFWPKMIIFENGTSLTAMETFALLREDASRSGHRAMEKFFAEHKFRVPQIPKAPSMTVYCMYGVNQQSELGFHYNSESMVINSTANADNGVLLGDGDATVPLLSLGYVCRAPDAWALRSRVFTMEFNHMAVPSFKDPRGGARTADHVDIMGNYELLTAILNIASGNEHKLQERVTSSVDSIIAELRGLRR